MIQDVEKLLVMLSRLGEIKGRTRFQKIVFLLKKHEESFSYDFIPYRFGPYCQNLQIEINLLEAAGLIKVGHSKGVLYTHHLTKQGKKAVKQIEKGLEKAELRNFSRVLRKFNKLSTRSLIREAKRLSGMLD